MKTFKRIIALILVVVLSATLMCACKKTEDEPDHTAEIVENDTIKHEASDQVFNVPENEMSEEPIIVGQVLVIDPTANFSISSTTNGLENSRDIIHVDSDEIESNGDPIVAELSHSGMIFNAKLGEGARYGDVVTITPDETEVNALRYSVRTADINLDVEIDKATSVSFSLAANYLKTASTVGEFSYNAMLYDDMDSIYFSIEGNVGEESDIEIYKKDDKYYVSSTSNIESLMVRMMNMNPESDGSMSMADAMEPASNYEISFNENGSLVINAIEQ